MVGRIIENCVRYAYHTESITEFLDGSGQGINPKITAKDVDLNQVTRKCLEYFTLTAILTIAAIQILKLYVVIVLKF